MESDSRNCLNSLIFFTFYAYSLVLFFFFFTAEQIGLFNNVGKMLNKAFNYAKAHLDTITCVGKAIVFMFIFLCLYNNPAAK